MFIRHQDSIT